MERWSIRTFLISKMLLNCSNYPLISSTGRSLLFSELLAKGDKKKRLGREKSKIGKMTVSPTSNFILKFNSMQYLVLS